MRKFFPKPVFIIVLFGLLGLYFAAKKRNPYPEVEWVEDWPGAGDRYRTFTPVLKADSKTVVGPTVGADYGALSFEDTDNDGVKEVIVESDESFSIEECSHERHTLKYRLDSLGKAKFTLLKSEVLEYPKPLPARSPLLVPTDSSSVAMMTARCFYLGGGLASRNSTPATTSYQ